MIVSPCQRFRGATRLSQFASCETVGPFDEREACETGEVSNEKRHGQGSQGAWRVVAAGVATVALPSA